MRFGGVIRSHPSPKVSEGSWKESTGPFPRTLSYDSESSNIFFRCQTEIQIQALGPYRSS